MNERKNEIISAIITTIITLAVLLFMIWYVLPGIEVPQEQPYITMMEDAGGDMLAKLGDTPDPTESDHNDDNEPENAESTETGNEAEGDELQDAGKVAPLPPKNITTEKPSPMKVKTVEKKDDDKKKTGASKPNPKPQAKAANKRSQGASSKVESETDKRMKTHSARALAAAERKVRQTAHQALATLAATAPSVRALWAILAHIGAAHTAATRVLSP